MRKVTQKSQIRQEIRHTDDRNYPKQPTIPTTSPTSPPSSVLLTHRFHRLTCLSSCASMGKCTSLLWVREILSGLSGKPKLCEKPMVTLPTGKLFPLAAKQPWASIGVGCLREAAKAPLEGKGVRVSPSSSPPLTHYAGGRGQ